MCTNVLLMQMLEWPLRCLHTGLRTNCAVCAQAITKQHFRLGSGPLGSGGSFCIRVFYVAWILARHEQSAKSLLFHLSFLEIRKSNAPLSSAPRKQKRSVCRVVMVPCGVTNTGNRNILKRGNYQVLLLSEYGFRNSVSSASIQMCWFLILLTGNSTRK